MQPYYTLSIVTPQGLQYREEIVHALVPGEIGFVGVLAYHAPFVTSSAGGPLEVQQKNGQTKKFNVGAGFFEVRDNNATLLTESFRAAVETSAGPH